MSSKNNDVHNSITANNQLFKDTFGTTHQFDEDAELPLVDFGGGDGTGAQQQQQPTYRSSADNSNNIYAPGTPINIIVPTRLNNLQQPQHAIHKGILGIGGMPLRIANQKRFSLPMGYIPGDKDVVCGRGKRNWNHLGNINFRNVIRNNTPRYIDAPTKNDKTIVVISIVDEIRRQGGRFLKEDMHGRWYDIGDAQARDKVGHSLRDQVSAFNRAKNKKAKTAAATEMKKQILMDTPTSTTAATITSSHHDGDAASVNSFPYPQLPALPSIPSCPPLPQQHQMPATEAYNQFQHSMDRYQQNQPQQVIPPPAQQPQQQSLAQELSYEQYYPPTESNLPHLNRQAGAETDMVMNRRLSMQSDSGQEVDMRKSARMMMAGSILSTFTRRPSFLAFSWDSRSSSEKRASTLMGNDKLAQQKLDQVRRSSNWELLDSIEDFMDTVGPDEITGSLVKGITNSFTRQMPGSIGGLAGADCRAGRGGVGNDDDVPDGEEVIGTSFMSMGGGALAGFDPNEPFDFEKDHGTDPSVPFGEVRIGEEAEI